MKAETIADIRRLVADAQRQADMEWDNSPTITVSLRVLEILARPRLSFINQAEADEADKQAVARRLRAARIAKFEASVELARAAAVLGVTLRAHETGRNGIGQVDVARYADALDVDASWILTGNGKGPTYPPTVGGRLRIARRTAGYSVRKLAGVFKRAPATIREQEASDVLPRAHAVGYADELRVGLEWLLFGAGDPPVPK